MSAPRARPVPSRPLFLFPSFAFVLSCFVFLSFLVSVVFVFVRSFFSRHRPHESVATSHRTVARAARFLALGAKKNENPILIFFWTGLALDWNGLVKLSPLSP